ncbi:PREDICTED: uncharacterized protein LOC104809294 isoform X3 [Tarenaya hassleriana]|uniref:uncharacterized protein LOC104809294 isoform X3 n=1 Tax=Tarenaya hassleriana TaxID=28532 RepID=UPI00053C78CC|nr:PREDICTED: uncharacterized protein LOC104809294 isoform X3 [Tarenaya hassleriana]
MVVRLTFLMVFVCKYKKEVFMQLLVHARRERGREDEWWSRSGVDSSGFVHLPIGNSPVSVAVTVTVTKQSEKMKGSGGVVASVIALSTVAVSSSSAPPPSPNSPKISLPWCVVWSRSVYSSFNALGLCETGIGEGEASGK